MSLFIESVFASLIASIIFEGSTKSISIWQSNMLIDYWLNKCFKKAIKRYCINSDIASKIELKSNEYNDHLRKELFNYKIDFTTNTEQRKLLQLFEEEATKHFILKFWVIIQQNKCTKTQLNEVLLKIDALICSNIKLSEDVSVIKKLSNSIGKKLGVEILEFTNEGCVLMPDKISLHIANRTELINTIIEESGKGKCILLNGSKSIGKSTLLTLIYHRLQNENIECKFLNFDYRVNSDIKQALIDVNLSNCKYILIDSIDLSQGNILDKNIAYIHDLIKKGVNIIISSYQNIPAAFTTVNTDKFLEMVVPPFALNDITEIINSYQGNPTLSQTVYLYSNGHPVVVKALCLFLKQHNWSINNDIFADIITFNFSKDIQESLSSILTKIIPDSLTRELLNRLLVIIDDVTDENINLVANINPPINEARSKFQTIKPLLFEEDAKGRYKVSPLLKNIWKPDLLNCVKKDVNSILGHSIINKYQKSLNQKHISNAIIYLINGEEVDLAGFLYLKYLIFITENPNLFQRSESINLFWIDMPLPESMNCEIKLIIRSCQAIIYRDDDKVRDYVLKDFVIILHNSDISTGKRALFYRWLAAVYLINNNISDSFNYYKKGIELGPPEIEGLEVSNQIALNYESGIWLLLSKVRTVHDFTNWLYLYNNSIKPEMKSEDIITCISFVDMYSYDRLADCDIPQLKRELYEILELCKTNSIDILSILVGCKLIYSEGIDSQLDEAVSLYESFISNYNDNDIAILLLNKAIGDTYYITDNNVYKEQIYEYYKKALIGDKHNTLIEYKIITSLKLSSVSKIEESFNLIKESYLLYKKGEDLPQYIKFNIIGEHSIILWEAKNKYEAIRKISDGYKDLVLNKFNDSEEFKTLLVLYGGCLRYYVYDIEGKPEDKNSIVPKRGIFLKNRINLSDLYTEEKKLLFAQMLFSVFDKLELYEDAKYWMNYILKNKDIVTDFKSQFGGLFFLYLPYLLLDNNYSQIAMLFYEVRQSTIKNQKKNPNLTTQTDDDYLRLYILPCVIKALHTYFMSKEKGIEELTEIYNIVLNHKAFASDIELVDMFAGYIRKFINDGYLERKDVSNVNELNVQNKYSLHCLVYLLMSINTDAKYAYELQMAFVPEFEIHFLKLHGKSIYLWLIPLFEIFWETQRQNKPKDFDTFDHLQNRGVSLINSKNGTDRLKAIFRVHLNHINNITLNIKQESWLDS